MVIDVHETDRKTATLYRIVLGNVGVRAYISNGSIEVEMKDGSVIHADSPRELRDKLRKGTNL